MLCNNKLLVELSLVGKLATKLVLLFFVWVLNCLFKSPVRMDARQTVRGPEPVMFGIKVMQFTHSAVLCECLSEFFFLSCVIWLLASRCGKFETLRVTVTRSFLFASKSPARSPERSSASH